MRTDLKLFLSIWLVYAVFVTPAGGVLPNRYTNLVHAIVNEGRLTVDTYHENTIDKAFYNGHYYLLGLPGPSFIGVPAYVIFKGAYALVPQPLKDLAGGVQSFKKTAPSATGFYAQVDNVEFFLSQLFLTLAVMATVSAFGSVMLYRVLRQLGCSERVSVLTVLFYAFGTIVFFYSTLFFEQVFSATLAIGAFNAALPMLMGRRQNSVGLFIAGLAAGYAILVEYVMILFAAWLGVWLMFRVDKRRLILYVVGFAIPICLMLGYNIAAFDEPFSTPYRYIPNQQRLNHAEGFFGITYPHLDRLAGLLASPERGLFLFAPIALVGVWGLVDEIRKRRARAAIAFFALALFAAILLFYASYTDWRGGAVFGPRFLIATLPFLLIGVGLAFETLPSRAIHLIGVLSILINWIGAQFGFAESVGQHFQTLVVQGPTLSIFGAILSHSSSRESPLYLFAAQTHVAITLLLTIGLIGVVVWMFRDVWDDNGRNQATTAFRDWDSEEGAR